MDSIAFYAAGTTSPASPVTGGTFDVANAGDTYAHVFFLPTGGTVVSPDRIRLDPGTRQTVAVSGPANAAMRYVAAFQTSPFATHTKRLQLQKDGVTKGIIPVAAASASGLSSRLASILEGSKVAVSEAGTYNGAVIYTPGPYYLSTYNGSMWARDVFYTEEGANYASAAEMRAMVSFYLSHSTDLPITTYDFFSATVTYPVGSIPDHVMSTGVPSWLAGPPEATNHYTDRPSIDSHLIISQLAWLAAHKAGWDATSLTWLAGVVGTLEAAYAATPKNGSSGLVKQHDTSQCPTEGFLDNYLLTGDNIPCSVLAVGAARALADIYEALGNAVKVAEWETKASDMIAAVRGAGISETLTIGGVATDVWYLPWTVGGNCDVFSPEYTAYAVLHGIANPTESRGASDYFAALYAADKAAGTAEGDLFCFGAGVRGAVRNRRKSQDYAPGSQAWPPCTQFGSQYSPYRTYQNGGYWYEKLLGVAATLAVAHIDIAHEWLGNMASDIVADGTGNQPYERVDYGTTPVNGKYNASIGQVSGAALPAAAVQTFSVDADPGATTTTSTTTTAPPGPTTTTTRPPGTGAVIIRGVEVDEDPSGALCFVTDTGRVACVALGDAASARIIVRTSVGPRGIA
jgi:hypothetical protein